MIEYTVKVYNNGFTYWELNGKNHREGDKPAIEGANGYKAWWLNGSLHREGDKPAVEGADGTKEWFKNGKRHREGDKPAYEKANGTKEWFKNGKLHRENGAAIIRASGHKYWYLNGERLTETQHAARTQPIKTKQEDQAMPIVTNPDLFPSAKLVVLGEDYSNDQNGFISACCDGAVHTVDIDEQYYTALYNVQQAIEATAGCIGIPVSIGVAKHGQYIPLSVIEDTALTPDLDYQDLCEAFDLGLKHIAMKEAKELTVADIEKLLGHKVKVVK